MPGGGYESESSLPVFWRQKLGCQLRVGSLGGCPALYRRNAVLIELKPEYADMAIQRIKGEMGMLAEVSDA
jgi:hypothetical protein